MTFSRTLTARFLLPCALAALSVVLAAGASEEAEDDAPRGAVIRILTPPGETLEGRTEIEALAVDPEIRRVVFYVDGVEAARRVRAPWNARVVLDSPAREQTIEVKAFGARDKELGGDRVVVNRRPVPFRVRIESLEPAAGGGAYEVEADVSVPHGAAVGHVDFYVNENHAVRLEEPPFAARLEIARSSEGDFVRCAAFLADGRMAEDVEILAAPGLGEEIDVNLVQLQVLVTRRNGAPVTDLGREDFEVYQGGELQQVESFSLAPDVPLVLGLVLDTSGSMRGAWPQTIATAKRFLRQTLRRQDRAFLVDFNEKLTLVQPMTGDVGTLFGALDALRPEGSTALYDSILFSLLQFETEPGRRALVLMTDGFDSSSTTDERHAVNFGRKLGVPVYVVALPSSGGPVGGAVVHTLKLVTDPTGGRLLRVGSGGGLERAFAQIDAELRHRYVLTYSTDVLPDDKRQKIKVEVRGRKDVEVRAAFAWDQVS